VYEASSAGPSALCVVHPKIEKRPVTSTWRDPDVLFRRLNDFVQYGHILLNYPWVPRQHL